MYNLCKSKAYLVKGITIHWECDRTLINRKDDTPNNAKLFFPDGIVEYLDSETKNFTKINDKTCHHKNNFDDNKGKFEFAIQWHNEISEFKMVPHSDKNFFSFMDNSFWVLGGDRIYFDYFGKKVVFAKQVDPIEVKKLLSLLCSSIRSAQA